MQRCDRARIGRDPALQFLKRGPARWHGLALAAELHLPAGPFEEHHQLARHAFGDLMPEVLLDQCQRQVEPRRHAGRRARRPVADMDRVLVDGDLRKAPREIFGDGPVRSLAPRQFLLRDPLLALARLRRPVRGDATCPEAAPRLSAYSKRHSINARVAEER